MKKGIKIFLWISSLPIVIVVFLGIALLVNYIGERPGSSTAPSEPLYVDLKASVQFDGSQFIITNKDSFDWENIELEINAGLLKGGYKLSAELMSAGGIYTVGAMQFAKSDGTRLNPFLIKPQSIRILCDTPKGKGFYSGKWK